MQLCLLKLLGTRQCLYARIRRHEDMLKGTKRGTD